MNFSAVGAHKRNGQQQEPGAGSRELGARTRARKWGRRTKDQGPRTQSSCIEIYFLFQHSQRAAN